MKNIITLLSLSLFITACNLEDAKNLIKTDPSNCAEHKLLYPNSTKSDGFYRINLDQDPSTPNQNVYCDFTGGGWTQVISPSTLIGDLEEYGDTTGVASTLYYDAIKGIGWGDSAMTGGSNPSPAQMSCFTFSKIKSFSQVKITTSWDGLQGNGYLYVSNSIAPSRYASAGEYYGIIAEEGLMISLNAWSGTPGGKNRVTVYRPSPFTDYVAADITGSSELVTITENYSSNGTFQICMSGEDPAAYDRRFITNLSFR